MKSIPAPHSIVTKFDRGWTQVKEILTKEKFNDKEILEFFSNLFTVQLSFIASREEGYQEIEELKKRFTYHYEHLQEQKMSIKNDKR